MSWNPIKLVCLLLRFVTKRDKAVFYFHRVSMFLIWKDCISRVFSGMNLSEWDYDASCCRNAVVCVRIIEVVNIIAVAALTVPYITVLMRAKVRCSEINMEWTATESTCEFAPSFHNCCFEWTLLSHIEFPIWPISQDELWTVRRPTFSSRLVGCKFKNIFFKNILKVWTVQTALLPIIVFERIYAVWACQTYDEVFTCG